MAARRAARAERRGMDLFDRLRSGRSRASATPRGRASPHMALGSARAWTVQAVILTGAVAGAFIVAVIGLLVGAGLAGFWSP
jgi:hypothetical protein